MAPLKTKPMMSSHLQRIKHSLCFYCGDKRLGLQIHSIPLTFSVWVPITDACLTFISCSNSAKRLCSYIKISSCLTLIISCSRSLQSVWIYYKVYSCFYCFPLHNKSLMGLFLLKWWDEERGFESFFCCDYERMESDSSALWADRWYHIT